MSEANFDPSVHVGESVTVEGTARNAAAGAMLKVAGYGRPIYIDGLDSWDEDLVGCALEVTGVLRARDAQVPEGGDEPEHGLDTATFVLDGAEWTPVDDG